MAIYRYVDTAADVGGNGTTRLHSGEGDNAYNSLSVAEADLDDDFASLAAAGDNIIVKCAGSAADTTAVVWNAFGGDSIHTLTIMGDDGANDSGGDDGAAYNDDGRYTGNLDFSASHYRLELAAGSSGCLTLGTTSYVVIRDFQIVNTESSTSVSKALVSTSASSGTIDISGMRVWSGSAANGRGIQVNGAASGLVVTITNNISVFRSTTGSGIILQSGSSHSGSWDVHNNTIYGQGSGTGLYLDTHASSTETWDVANNAIGNFTNDINEFDSPTVAYSYNASDDADEGGNAISLGTHTDEWVDPVPGSPSGVPGDYDFTPRKGTSSLLRAGDSTYAPATDINGTTRDTTNPDIGAVHKPIETEYRYVDTAASSGGDGLTRDHTEGSPSGGSYAYNTLSVAEADVDDDYPKLTDHLVIKCAGSTADTTAVVWNALGSTVDFTLTLQGDDGTDDSASGGDDAVPYDDDGRYTGNLDYEGVSYYRLEANAQRVFFGYRPITLFGLQIKSTYTSASETVRIGDHTTAPAGSELVIDSCRIVGGNNSLPYGIFIDTYRGYDSDYTMTLQNNIVTTVAVGAVGCYFYLRDEWLGRINVYNNTVYGLTGSTRRGIQFHELSASTGTVFAANNAVGKWSDDFTETNTPDVTYSNNASDDGDGAGAITLGTHTDEWVDPTGSSPGDYDFNPKDFDSSLVGAGDSAYTPTLDINGTERHPTMPDVGALEVTPKPVITTGVEFDGTNDYYTTSSLTGAANGRTGTCSFLFKPSTAAGTLEAFFGFSVNVSRQSTGKLRFRANGTATSDRLYIESTTTLDQDEWYRVIASWDLSGSPGVGYMYINDVDVLNTTNLETDEDLDYTRASDNVGSSDDAGSSKLAGCLAEFFFSQADAVDLSVTANRRKFFDADGNPVWKGWQGATPTGSQPIIYLSGGATRFGSNCGSGGAFTETGALVDCVVLVFEATVSLNAAIAVQTSVAASVGAAIQASQSQTTSIDAAIATASTITAALDVAIAQTSTSSASLESAIAEANTAAASLNSAIAQSQTAAASVDGAIATTATAAASVDGAIATTATAAASADGAIAESKTAASSVDGAIAESQTGVAAFGAAIAEEKTGGVSVDGAIAVSTTSSASISAAISAAQTATASLAAAIAEAKTATAAVSAYIEAAGAGVVQSSLDAAISVANSAVASLSAAVSVAQTASVSLGAVISEERTASASFGAAILEASTAVAALSSAVSISQNAATAINAYIVTASSATLSVDSAILAQLSASVALSAYISTVSSAFVASTLRTHSVGTARSRSHTSAARDRSH